MAVQLEGSIQRYIGSSTDRKPDVAYDDGLVLPPGSSFFESDTGRIYRWDGDAWRYGSTDDVLQPLLEAIYVELTRIRAVVELTAGIDSAELVPA